jgi:(R,R)-butanediol dehydrogenase / meso-butanediol dehydrogenase / diacetyl reductase
VRALRWHGRHDVRVDDISPLLPPPVGQAQIKVLTCGICGTDSEELESGPLFIPGDKPHPLTARTPPITLGHEVCGRVVSVGSPADEGLVGQLVGVDGLITCGKCWACKSHRINLCEYLASIGFSADGGLAEFVNAPVRGCVPLEDNVDPDVGALAEPLAVAVRALRRGRLISGERVVVIGGGAVGQLTAQASVAGGASEVVLVEADPGRRASAARASGAHVVEPTDAPRAKADVVVECSGSPGGFIAGISAARPTGRLVLVGISPSSPPLPVLDLVRHEQEILGSLSHIYDQDFAAAVDLINRGVAGQGLACIRSCLDEAVDYLTGKTTLPDGVVKVLVDPTAKPDPRARSVRNARPVPDGGEP